MMYSYSSLTTFEQCPLKFKLRYIDKIEPEIPDTIEAFLGSRVHETLEKLYQDLKKDKLNTLEELLFFYTSQWEKKWNDDIRINNNHLNPAYYLQMGKSYITTYYNHYYPFDQSKTVEVEKHIIFDLDDNGDYKLQGFIDRLSEKEKGTLQIHDYKTNSRLPKPQELKKNKQLSLYALGIKTLYPQVNDISLTWHFLKFNKELTIKKTKKELEKVKKETIQLINKIEASNMFPANPSYLCKWCEYHSICPQWSHLYTVNEPPNEKLYTPTSMAKIVDRYADLKMKKNQLKLDDCIEIESIEQQFISYTNKKQTNSINGTTHVIQVNKHHSFILPSTKNGDQQKLLQYLQKQGKLPQDIDYSNKMVKQILENEPWTDKQIIQLKKFIHIKTLYSFQISKKQN